MKIVKKIQMKIFIFTAVKNRCILHGRVFVMALHIKKDKVQELQAFVLILKYLYYI